MHENSLAVYEKEADSLATRRAAVLAEFRKAEPSALYAREVMVRLGFVDPNKVRPRITELKNAGLLREVGNIRDPETGHTVAILRPVEQQGRLFDGRGQSVRNSKRDNRKHPAEVRT